MKLIQVKMEAALVEQLDEVSTQEGYNRSELIREAVRRYLKRHQTKGGDAMCSEHHASRKVTKRG